MQDKIWSWLIIRICVVECLSHLVTSSRIDSRVTYLSIDTDKERCHRHLIEKKTLFLPSLLHTMMLRSWLGSRMSSYRKLSNTLGSKIWLNSFYVSSCAVMLTIYLLWLLLINLIQSCSKPSLLDSIWYSELKEKL